MIFGPARTKKSVIYTPLDNGPDKPQRCRQFHEDDIASPRSYNLCSRRRIEETTHEESDGCIIPPAMFEESSERSYAFSNALDSQLSCDSQLPRAKGCAYKSHHQRVDIIHAATTQIPVSASINKYLPGNFFCCINE